MSENQQSPTQGSGSKEQQEADSQPQKKSAPDKPPATKPSERSLSRNDSKDKQTD